MKLLIVDCESTGKDPLDARLVTVFAGIMEDDGSWQREVHLMFDPGVEIPEEAAAVHGITTEKARAEGISVEKREEYLRKLRSFLIDSIRNQHLPLAAYNAKYDFTLLKAEFKRNGISPILWEDFFILDPFVIDKQIDKYRKGKRTLTAVAAHYGITVDESMTHDASYDCFLTGRIIQSEKFRSYDELKVSPSKLVRLQKMWARSQAESFEAYLKKNAESKEEAKEISVNGEWPEVFS